MGEGSRIQRVKRAADDTKDDGGSLAAASLPDPGNWHLRHTSLAGHQVREVRSFVDAATRQRLPNLRGGDYSVSLASGFNGYFAARSAGVSHWNVLSWSPSNVHSTAACTCTDVTLMGVTPAGGIFLV